MKKSTRIALSLASLVAMFDAAHAAQISTQGQPSAYNVGALVDQNLTQLFGTLTPIVTPALLHVTSGGTGMPNSQTASKTAVMTRKAAVMRASVQGKVGYVLGCYWVPGAAGEQTPTAPCTFTGSYEYPAGTFQQMTCAGATTCTVPAGTQLLSDLFATPAVNGAQFWERLFQSNTSGVLMKQIALNVANGDATVLNGTDQTMSGTVSPGSFTNAPGGGYQTTPLAVVGMTTARSVGVIAGDSRPAGSGDTASANSLDIGEVCRAVGRFAPCLNAAVSGDTQAGFIASHANRVLLDTYLTDEWQEDGVNDVVAGASLATIQANDATIKGYWNGKKTTIATMEPYTTQALITASGLTANGNGLVLTVPSTTGLYVGEFVTIAGATPTTDNGPCQVNVITNATTFSCTNANATGTATATGTITVATNWQDVVNQTKTANDAVRTAENDFRRANSLAFNAVVDAASVGESGLNAGTWDNNTGYATGVQLPFDGVHRALAGQLMLVNSGIINPRGMN